MATFLIILFLSLVRLTLIFCFYMDCTFCVWFSLYLIQHKFTNKSVADVVVATVVVVVFQYLKYESGRNVEKQSQMRQRNVCPK